MEPLLGYTKQVSGRCCLLLGRPTFDEFARILESCKTTNQWPDQYVELVIVPKYIGDTALEWYYQTYRARHPSVGLATLLTETRNRFTSKATGWVQTESVQQETQTR